MAGIVMKLVEEKGVDGARKFVAQKIAETAALVREWNQYQMLYLGVGLRGLDERPLVGLVNDSKTSTSSSRLDKPVDNIS